MVPYTIFNTTLNTLRKTTVLSTLNMAQGCWR